MSDFRSDGKYPVERQYAPLGNPRHRWSVQRQARKKRKMKMQEEKAVIVRMNKENLSTMENWFTETGRWVFRYMADSSRYITSTLEDSPQSEKDEILKNKEKAKYELQQQQGIELKIALEQYKRGEPVRLVPFSGEIRKSISSIDIEKIDGSQAIWAIKVDPLICWLRDHSGGVLYDDETICENRAISLFAAIGCEHKTSEPPWIVPLKDKRCTDDNRWFLIPHRNEDFMYNLEQAFQFGKETLMNGCVLSVADFFNPLKIDNSNCVIVKMII